MTDEQLNEQNLKCAAAFGGRWLAANEAACLILQASRLRPEQNKELGMRVAARLCNWFQWGERLAVEHTDATGRLIRG